MPSIPSRRLLAAAVAITAIATLAGALQAATILRVPLENAVAGCQGSLPSYEGALRKRPTGIANEGTSTAFLSCSLAADDNGAGTNRTAIALMNRNDHPVSATCTMVTGLVNFPNYRTRTVPLAPGQLQFVEFKTTHTAGLPYGRYINYNCALLPGLEASYLFREFPEEVGQ